MTDRNDDPGIPTLTQRAPSRHEPPVLTQQADDAPPWDEPGSRDWGGAASADRVGTPPSPTVSQPVARPPAQPAPITPQANSRHDFPAAAPNRWQDTPAAPAPAREQPSDAVLRAALQADIEDAVQDALAEAMHLVRARLEARIPEIVAQAVKRTRMG